MTPEVMAEGKATF